MKIRPTHAQTEGKLDCFCIFKFKFDSRFSIIIAINDPSCHSELCVVSDSSTWFAFMLFSQPCKRNLTDCKFHVYRPNN